MAVLGTVLGTASTAATQVLQQEQFRLVDLWLSDTDTSFGAGKHISAGLSQEALSVIQAPLVSPKNRANNLMGQISGYLNVSPTVARYMNELNSMFQQPNIEGIVIFTEGESTDREADVSTTPMVVQADLVSTSYVTDNATPKPRTWQLKGHLAQTLVTDSYFIIKPSLLLQRQYLDNCIKSRKPVWFKTYDNQFVLTLITKMSTSYDPKSMNTMAISINLMEYVPIRVYEGPISSAVASRVGAFLR